MQSLVLPTMQKVLSNILLNCQLIRQESAVKAEITPCRIVFMSQEIDIEYASTYAIKGPKKDCEASVIENFVAKHNISTKDLIISGDRYYYRPISDLTSACKYISVIMTTLTQKLSLIWPKRMHWNATRAEWIRPIRSIICLLDDHVIPFTFAGVSSGNVTVGNKNITGGKLIVINQADKYIESIRQNYVLLSSERRENILKAIRHLEDKYNCLCDYHKLLEEVVGLCEYPLVVIDDIDSQYLSLPHCILTATLNRDQRYLTVYNKQQELLPYYIFVAESTDANVDIIRSGNHKVLRSRLADAQFFFEQDRKRFSTITYDAGTIAKLLTNVPFLPGVGTMYDRVLRLQSMAQKLWQSEDLILKMHRLPQPVLYQESNYWAAATRSMKFDDSNLNALQAQWQKIASQNIESLNPQPSHSIEFTAGTDNRNLAKYAEQMQHVIQYAKLDLTSNAVNEFRELQGQIGGDYAQKFWGLSTEVSYAISCQYQIDRIFSSPNRESVLLAAIYAIMNRIDYIASHFHIQHRPTNSGDPFALRRARNEICALATMNYHFDFIINLPLTEPALSPLLAQEFRYLTAEIRSFILKGFEDIDHMLISTSSLQKMNNVYELAKIIHSPLIHNGWIFVSNVILPLHKRIQKLIGDYQKSANSQTSVSNETEAMLMQQALLYTEQIPWENTAEIGAIIAPIMKLSELLEQYLDDYIINHEDASIKNARMNFLVSIISALEKKFPLLNTKIK